MSTAPLADLSKEELIALVEAERQEKADLKLKVTYYKGTSSMLERRVADLERRVADLETAKQSIIDEIEEYLADAVTLEVMVDPVTLENGQTFDRHSIESMLYGGRYFKCPATRAIMKVPKNPPRSFIVANIIEMYNRLCAK
jgi:hypothetical protein